MLFQNKFLRPSELSRNKLTLNEKCTLFLSFATAVLAGVSVYQSYVSKDMGNAVEKLAALAEEAKTQSVLSQRQISLLSRQVIEQRSQSKSLSSQADSALQSAVAGQTSVKVAQKQLLNNQAYNAQQRKDAAASELYSIRLRSMAEFMKADGAFFVAIDRIRARLFVDLEKSPQVLALSRADLERLREIVEPATAAQLEYRSAFRSTMAAWPASVRGKMVATLNHAAYVAACFGEPATRAVTEQEAATIRRDTVLACRDIEEEYGSYRSDSEGVWHAMAIEVYRASRAAGVDPEISFGRLPR